MVLRGSCKKIVKTKFSFSGVCWQSWNVSYVCCNNNVNPDIGHSALLIVVTIITFSTKFQRDSTRIKVNRKERVLTWIPTGAGWSSQKLLFFWKYSSLSLYRCMDLSLYSVFSCQAPHWVVVTTGPMWRSWSLLRAGAVSVRQSQMALTAPCLLIGPQGPVQVESRAL